MRGILIVFGFLCFGSVAMAQSDELVDTKYLEDQIYFSLSYDILVSKPETITQHGLSGGYSIGFLKDIPLNEPRTIAVAIGLGYTYDAYIQNLKITNTELTTFEAATDFSSNSLRVHLLELPLELRWRNSTPTKYKFWRAYAGLKVGYVIKARTKFSDEGGIYELSKIPEMENIHYGLYIAVGYGTWNLYAHMGLNEMFSNANLNGEPIRIKPLKIGLKFYIL